MNMYNSVVIVAGGGESEGIEVEEGMEGLNADGE